MAIWEPLTDGAKMLREMVGFAEDAVRFAGTLKTKADKKRFSVIATSIAHIHFQHDGMPAELLKVIADGDVAAQTRALENIRSRLDKTDEQVAQAMGHLLNLQQFLQFHLGLEYSSDLLSHAKTRLRDGLQKLESLSSPERRSEATFILESILAFNKAMAALHRRVSELAKA